MRQGTDEQSTRRIRPWIAALLTLLNWGLGFYYAGQAREAWRWAFIQVGVAVVLGVSLLVAMLTLSALPFDPTTFGPIDALSYGVSALVAVTVWIATARRPLAPKSGPVRLWGYLAILIVPLVISATFGFGLRAIAYQPFRIPSSSMAPTLTPGVYAVVSKFSYGYSRFSVSPFQGLLPEGRVFARAPKRGDIIVFHPAGNPDQAFVSRLVGLPGETIQMVGGVLHIDGIPVVTERLEKVSEDPLMAQEVMETLPNGVSYQTYDTGLGPLDDTAEFTVPEGHYFVLGDHRDNAVDSRLDEPVGFVAADRLVGRVDRVVRIGA